MTALPTIYDEILARIIATSYRNFHAKGVDYICLHRSPEITIKAYFFDGPVIGLQEVVCPHDHRYDFATEVLAGGVDNAVWQEVSLQHNNRGEVHARFAFHTPLNGGVGFTFEEEVRLRLLGTQPYRPGCRHMAGFDTIHTLANVLPSTVLLLWQYAAAIPPSWPSHAYCRHREPPSLSGLYDRHKSDSVIVRLRQIETLRPGLCAKHGLAGLLP